MQINFPEAEVQVCSPEVEVQVCSSVYFVVESLNILKLCIINNTTSMKL